MYYLHITFIVLIFLLSTLNQCALENKKQRKLIKGLVLIEFSLSFGLLTGFFFNDKVMHNVLWSGD